MNNQTEYPEIIKTTLILDFIADIDEEMSEIKTELARLDSIKPLIGPDKKLKKLLQGRLQVKASSRVALRQLLDRSTGYFYKRSKADEERLLHMLCM